MAEVQGAGWDYGVAEALAGSWVSTSVVRFERWLDWVFGGRVKGEGGTYGGSCGPDAVEHIGSEGDGDKEVFWVADAHYIARFVLREPVCAGIHARLPPPQHDQTRFITPGFVDIGITRTYTLQ